MSERELPREVAAALKALDQAESLAAEYAAIRGEDDEVAATKIRAVAMNLERWARASPTPPTTEGRMREALEACAAPWDSGQTTVPGAFPLLAVEFQRRMNIAGAALSPPDGDGKQEQATRAEDGPTAPTDR